MRRLDDLEGLERAVAVVLVEPVVDALGEHEVQVRLVERADFGADLLALAVPVVDEAHALHVEQTHLVGGVAACPLEPLAHEHELVRDVEAVLLGIALEELVDLLDELGCESFVGVEVEDPLVLERDVLDGPVALLAERLEGVDVGAGAGGSGELNGAVLRAGVEHVDVVAPGARGEAVGDVDLFVERQHHDRDRRARRRVDPRGVGRGGRLGLGSGWGFDVGHGLTTGSADRAGWVER